MHGLAQTSKIQFMQPCKKKENLPRIDSKVSKKVNDLMISKGMGILLFKSKGGKGGGGLRVNLFSSSIRCMNYVICTVLYIIMNEFCDTQKAKYLIY